VGELSGLYVFRCEDCRATSPSYRHPSHASRVGVAHVCAEVCPACEYRHAPPNSGMRGLCNTCYRDPDIRIDYETRIWNADDLLDTWDELRREGHTLRQAAERIGVTFAALEKAIARAAKRGDHRARRPGQPAPKVAA
jgi:hypothetical protein